MGKNKHKKGSCSPQQEHAAQAGITTASVSTAFPMAVQATPDIASHYQSGLQALGNHSACVVATDTRQLTGSVDIDAATRAKYPNDSRWDYVLGYGDKAYFVEVHPASTSNVSEMIKKKQWLEAWLSSQAPDLDHIKAKAPYYWVPSGNVAILPNSKQAKQIAALKIMITKLLKL